MSYIVKDVSHVARGLRLPSHMAVTDNGRVALFKKGHSVKKMSLTYSL